MKKILMISTAVLLINVAGISGCKKEPAVVMDEFATVLGVEAITETIKVPRQECYDEVITHQTPPTDRNKITGTAVGAVVGGLLGNQLGGGSGKKVATTAGVVAGGYAGRQVQGNIQAGDTYTTTEKRCETVYDFSEKTVGYNVKYKLNGETDTVSMDYDPGKTIAVKDGQLVLTR